MSSAADIQTRLIPDPILSCLKLPGGDDSCTLELGDGLFRCRETGAVMPFRDGLPSLYTPNEQTGRSVTDKVKAFYEENPFPNYEGIEEFGELVRKGSQNPFSANLLKAIGNNKLVLEVGCGTGQLSHFLQLNHNFVLGTDQSLGSLRLATNHKTRNNLERSSFVQMDIFNLAIKDESFDVVITHGVLHHTFDAKLAFQQIVRKLKPGGIIIVGLYNRYARIPTWLRSKAIGVLGSKIDFVVRNQIQDAEKARIWIQDQYYNPHETWHSIDEVMGWFAQSGIQYLNCSPAILDTDGEGNDELFAKTQPGNAYQRVVTQLSWIGTIAREGGLFDLIGRKIS